MKKSFIFCFIAISSIASVYSQNISGIINSYSPVTAIDTSGCRGKVTVVSSSLFSIGDKVLLIQMKGALIDTTNTASFGNILNFNGAGSYEFATVQNILGAVITLNGHLVNTYDINGHVQLIKVSVYGNATVVATLTSQSWNGSTGGVLAFEVTGTLTLNADIDVSGNGFRGGNISNNPDGSCGSGSPLYHYPLYQPGNFWNFGGAMKGEGITEIDTSLMAGRGALANGGGGGNKHNCGGGGGGNYTTGGKGGNELYGCPITMMGGIGGLSMYNAIVTNKIFLGGGGGCGDYNNAVGSNGEDGGGIIFIKSAAITGNNFSIKADGNDETIVGCCIADGVGGGGAGGSIFLDVSTFNGNLNLTADGGDGGDQNPTYGCVGTGGGAGTGVIVTSLPSLPGNVSWSTIPGVAGVFLNASFPTCYNSTYGAADGQANSNAYLAGYNFIETPDAIPFNFSLGNDTSICGNSSFLLNAALNGATYSWQNNSTDSIFLATTTGIYWVDVTLNGCTVRDSIILNFITLPPVLGNDTTLCSGQTLLLNATTTNATAYLWQNNSSNPTFLVTVPGIYWVDITYNGCVFRDSITVNYFNSLTVFLGNDTTVCGNNSFLLNAALPGATYSWQNNSTDSTFLATSSGIYWVDVTLNGCTVRDSITLNFVTLSPVLGNDTTLCSGQTLLLNATTTNASAYLWQNNSSNSTFLVSVPGIYWVDITYNGCIFRDSIIVNYNNSPVVFLGNDTTLCQGDILILNAFLAGASYQWQNNSSGSIFNVNAPGTYWVNVSLNGCSSSDTIIVSYVNSIGNILGNDTTICKGNNLLLDASPANGNNYQWQDNSANSTYTVSAPGIFWVNVLLGNCSYSDTIQIKYDSLPDVNLGNDTSFCHGGNIYLDAYNDGATYKWQNQSTNFYYSVTDTGKYFVNVSNFCGSVSDTILILYGDCHCNLCVPNVFTPNEDAYNNSFNVVYDCNFSSFDIKIFNRWGQIVFESNNAQQSWNGTSKGKLFPEGVYYYIITYSSEDFDNGKQNQRTGSITLIR